MSQSCVTKLQTAVNRNSFDCACALSTALMTGTQFAKFMEFHAAVDMTGKGLAAKILSILCAHNLGIQHMVGQGYDRAESLAGRFSGIQYATL